MEFHLKLLRLSIFYRTAAWREASLKMQRLIKNTFNHYNDLLIAYYLLCPNYIPKNE